ncbi:uncharacterized protein [Centruroides vittatus]|uniref:uncharacterized protein n=1 Tax=Centruroides vittatus TaxID=120091 RepID=UPI00350F83D1
MNGTTIKVEKSLRYLGVILDFRLVWDSHITYITDRTGLISQAFSQVAKQKWGLTSKTLSIVYDGIYIPTITYGCGTWGWAISKVHPRRKIISSQRRMLLMISKAYRTTSNVCLQVITRKPPIDLVIEERQKLFKLKRGENIKVDTREIKHQDIEWPSPIDCTLPLDKSILSRDMPMADDTMVIYTDGSVHDNKVGCSFVVFDTYNEIDNCKFHLHDECTIFQAEMWAIKMAVTYSNENFKNKNIKIYTNSLSSAQTIKNRNLHPIAEEIRKLIHLSINKYDIEWVKAHQGEMGNEQADLLAKEAATDDNLPISYNKLTKRTTCNILKKETIRKWQQTWNQHNEHITYKFITDIEQFIHNKWYRPNHHISQLLTDHGKFATYLHRFNHCTSNICPSCQMEEDGTLHYLFRCPTFDRERIELQTTVQEHGLVWPCRPSDIWTFKDTIEAFDRLCKQVNFINSNHNFD